MLRSIERGLSLNEWEVMTVGMIIDFIIFYNNEYSQDKKEVRQATQDDFDRF